MVVRTFGEVIREHRRRLNLTQRQVASRIGVSTPFVGHLELSKRRPSQQTVRRLADLLGLDQADLFLAANPEAAELLRGSPAAPDSSAWDEFRLGHLADVDPQEIDLLSRVASMGRVRSPSDFLYVLNCVRQALGREVADFQIKRSPSFQPQ
jgi:transcriptional regulator with XRE-family HTH domain